MLTQSQTERVLRIAQVQAQAQQAAQVILTIIVVRCVRLLIKKNYSKAGPCTTTTSLFESNEKCTNATYCYRPTAI